MDQETLNLLSAVSGVVSVIALIVFFVMAGNIAAIKKSISKKDEEELLYNFFRNQKLGRNDEAKRILEDLIYMEWRSEVFNIRAEEIRAKRLVELKEKYADYMQRVNMKWPELLD